MTDIPIDWTTIDYIEEFLTRGYTPDYQGQPTAIAWARLSKIGEEFGEAIQAYIGYTGQNPRKGYTHTLDDVTGELADVIVTAMLAIRFFTGSTDEMRQIIVDKMEFIQERIAGTI